MSSSLFLWVIKKDNGDIELINPTAIRVVEEIRHDYMRIRFDDRHTIALEGGAASQMFEYLEKHAFNTNRDGVDIKQMLITARPK